MLGSKAKSFAIGVLISSSYVLKLWDRSLIKFEQFTYSNLLLNLLFNTTGTTERIAIPPSMRIFEAVKISSVDFISCREIPALMARNDGGATPSSVPRKNHTKFTPTIGDAMLISQFGRNGVIRRNTI